MDVGNLIHQLWDRRTDGRTAEQCLDSKQTPSTENTQNKRSRSYRTFLFIFPPLLPHSGHACAWDCVCVRVCVHCSKWYNTHHSSKTVQPEVDFAVQVCVCACVFPSCPQLMKCSAEKMNSSSRVKVFSLQHVECKLEWLLIYSLTKDTLVERLITHPLSLEH